MQNKPNSITEIIKLRNEYFNKVQSWGRAEADKWWETQADIILSEVETATLEKGKREAFNQVAWELSEVLIRARELGSTVDVPAVIKRYENLSTNTNPVDEENKEFDLVESAKHIRKLTDEEQCYCQCHGTRMESETFDRCIHCTNKGESKL